MPNALSFDPTHGYTLETLLQVPAPKPPDDFEQFWRDTYAEAMAIPLELEHRRIDSPDARFELLEVEYNSLGGARIGAWLTVPIDGKFTCGVVFGHGYGGREAPGFDVPTPPAAVIFPCARGFHRSASPNFPSSSGQHVLHGIDHRDTYSHRGSAADYWLAASALLELYPQCRENLNYLGGSFGGGIGALLLPWDDRIRKAYLDVPSFGNHPLRVTWQCTGAGESVRRLYQTRPEILEVLKYFDTAIAAQFIRVPTLVAAALSDPSVPPPGQFAVYNAMKCEKELFLRKTGHPYDPADSAQLHERLKQWFA